MKKTSYTVRDLLIAEARAAIAFWPRASEHEVLAIEIAAELLAHWAHLSRLVPSSETDALLRELEALFSNDERIVKHALKRSVTPNELLNRIDALSEEWASRGIDDPVDDLREETEEIFNEYDKAALCSFGAGCHIDETAAQRTAYQTLAAAVVATEDLIIEHIEAFLPARYMVAAFLSEYRSLSEMATDLAEITEKFLIIRQLQADAEQGIEEDSAEPVTWPEPKINTVVRLADFRRPESPDPKIDESEQLRAAATSGLDRDVSIDVGEIRKWVAEDFPQGRLVVSAADNGVNLHFVPAASAKPPPVVMLDDSGHVAMHGDWKPLSGGSGYILSAAMPWQSGKVILRFGSDYSLTILT